MAWRQQPSKGGPRLLSLTIGPRGRGGGSEPQWIDILFSKRSRCPPRGASALPAEIILIFWRKEFFCLLFSYFKKKKLGKKLGCAISKKMKDVLSQKRKQRITWSTKNEIAKNQGTRKTLSNLKKKWKNKKIIGCPISKKNESCPI